MPELLPDDLSESRSAGEGDRRLIGDGDLRRIGDGERRLQVCELGPTGVRTSLESRLRERGRHEPLGPGGGDLRGRGDLARIMGDLARRGVRLRSKGDLDRLLKNYQHQKIDISSNINCLPIISSW